MESEHRWEGEKERSEVKLEVRDWPAPICAGQKWSESLAGGLGELEVRLVWTLPRGCSPSSLLWWMSCIQVGQQPWVVMWAAEGGGPSGGRLEMGFCDSHCLWWR